MSVNYHKCFLGLNSNYQQLVSNYQQFARFASVIIYKIYRFREAERRTGEKKKIHKIYEISLACEQEKNNLQDLQDFARLRAGGKFYEI